MASSIKYCCQCSRTSTCSKCACATLTDGCTNCKSPRCKEKNKRNKQIPEAYGATSSRNVGPESINSRLERAMTVHRQENTRIALACQEKLNSMTQEDMKEALTKLVKEYPCSVSKALNVDLPHPADTPNWCFCQQCKIMPTSVENKCCNQDPCITNTDTFRDLCLKRNVVEVAGVLNYCDTFHDTPTYESKHYRNAAYRFYVLWWHNVRGRGNRICAPSCVVNKIRETFPSEDGVYEGFHDS